MGDLTKNFSSYEFQCPCCKQEKMSELFVSVLQKVRDDINAPMAISSGYRCKKHNAAVGGVDGSSHMFGLAVDVKCLTGGLRYKIIEAAIKNGITRIGVSGQFVHLDLDKNKPQNVVWTY